MIIILSNHKLNLKKKATAKTLIISYALLFTFGSDPGQNCGSAPVLSGFLS